ncbi:MAG: pyridoxal-phosphate dependent enzyme, partial [Aeoliella sp.]
MTTYSPATSLPRVQLAHLPTPLEKLSRLSRVLGGQPLWIKRDDQTGLATGGNKTRKLEFLIADALARGSDCVMTAGGAQSNHCRQTAAAAARHGLECHLVLGGEPGPVVGNLLLDQLLGAELHWVQKPARNAKMQSLADELAEKGRSPYVIPIGGSNAIGAVGYALAFHELGEQLAERGIEIDRVVFPTSSGGTQAGMVLGA